MTEKDIAITKEAKYEQKIYKFAYCLKQGHLQSIKNYVCLEEKCQDVKQICQFCFAEGSQHHGHQIIFQDLLLRIAQQKLLSSKISQQLEKIGYNIEKLQTNEKAVKLVEALQELKELLSKVENFDTIKEFNVFKTNAILELVYKMISFNKNFVMIKEPLSLKITEFEIPVETVSSVFDMVAIKSKRLNENIDPQQQLLEFQEIKKQKKKESEPYDDFKSLYDKPKKSYTKTKQIQSSQQNNKSDNSDSQSIRTRSMDMAFEQSTLTKKLNSKMQKKNNKNKEKLGCPEKIQKSQKESGDSEVIQIESEQREDIQSLSKKSSLQELIYDYNNFQVVVDPSKMMLVQRAHEGEGSGNSFQQVVTLGEDGLLRFWNPTNLQCLHTINFKIEDLHFSQIRDIQYLKRIQCIAVVCKQSIAIINIKNYKIIKKIQVEANNLDSCDQLGQLFLVNPSQNIIMIYDMFTFSQVGQLKGTKEDITSLAYALYGGKYYYFTGSKNGNVSKFDLSKQEYLQTKKANKYTIFYMSTVRYQHGGDECLVTYSCNDYVKSSQIKFLDIQTMEVVVNLNFAPIDSAICYNNEIYLMQSNKNIVQIFVEEEKYTIKKMTKIPSSFPKGTDVFNEGLRWIKSQRIALLSQFNRTSHYSNLVAFPII